jgi:hypothetical protein
MLERGKDGTIHDQGMVAPRTPATARNVQSAGSPNEGGPEVNPEQALEAVYAGRTVECTAEEYPAIRRALQEKAGKWIDQGQDIRAQIALQEVRRLDALHNFVLGGADDRP